jgi:hypothetical protein
MITELIRGQGPEWAERSIEKKMTNINIRITKLLSVRRD